MKGVDFLLLFSSQRTLKNTLLFEIVDHHFKEVICL